jgi:hypothetical protein
MAGLTITLTAADNEAGTTLPRSITLQVLVAQLFNEPEGEPSVYLGGIKRNRRVRRWSVVVVFDQFQVATEATTGRQDHGHLQMLQDEFLNAEHLWIVKTGTVLPRLSRKTGVTGTFNYWTDDDNGILSDTLASTKKVVAIYQRPASDPEHAVDNFTVTFEEEVPTYA